METNSTTPTASASATTIVDTSAPSVATLLTPVYSTLAAAQAVLPADGQHVIISAKKNNSKGGGVADGWEVHTVVRAFGASIATLSEWAETVNAVLLGQAKESLKQWRTANPLDTQVPVSLFTAAQLREDFLSGGVSGSYTKEELERAFCASATWVRISTSAAFKTNSQYRTIADVFKSKVVALAGRSHGSLTDTDLNKMLAKLEEADLTTPFGAYVLQRIQKIMKDREDQLNTEIDINDL